MKDAMTPTNLASVVRMSRTLGRAYLFVEGATDKRVYERFTDDSRCFVRVAGDKEKVFATLAELNRDLPNDLGSQGAIGIVDADFDHVDGDSVSEQNVFRTDLHDLECLICRSPAFAKVLSEFGSDEKTTKFRQKHGNDIAGYLAAQAFVIGCLRWISAKEQFAFRFGESTPPEGTRPSKPHGLSYKKFVDQETLTVDVGELIKTVINHSQRHDIDQVELANRLRMLMSNGDDPWQVACGHDIVEVLSIGLHKALGTQPQADVTPDVIERSFRLAYELTHFKTTRLFASIVDWQQQNPTFCILAN